MQWVKHSGLGGDDERAFGVLADVVEHSRGGKHLHAVSRDVARGHVLHHLGHASALGVN